MSASTAIEHRRQLTGHARWRRLGHRVDVARRLVRVELAARHRGSALGWLWALAPPALQLLATYFLFTRVIPLDVPDYPVFLLVGILAWTWFSRSLADGVSSLEQRRDLVLRPGFSTELLPLTSVLVALVDYLIALPVLLIALTLTTGLAVEAMLLPALLAVQLLYCLGIALAVAPLQVFLRDVRQVVALAVGAGFWLTPIFYRRTDVPDSLAWIYDANPMAHLIVAQRQVLIAGELPSAKMLTLVAAAGLVVLAGGAAIFALCRHSVPERL